MLFLNNKKHKYKYINTITRNTINWDFHNEYKYKDSHNVLKEEINGYLLHNVKFLWVWSSRYYTYRGNWYNLMK